MFYHDSHWSSNCFVASLVPLRGQLHTLHLSRVRIDDVGIAALMAHLATDTHITSLRLIDTHITDDGLDSLVDALLAGAAHITHLEWLQNGMTTNASAFGLWRLVCHSRSLRVVHLGDEINPVALGLISGAIKMNYSLERMFIYAERSACAAKCYDIISRVTRRNRRAHAIQRGILQAGFALDTPESTDRRCQLMGLPEETMLAILSHLRWRDVGTACCVCKAWRRLVYAMCAGRGPKFYARMRGYKVKLRALTD